MLEKEIKSAILDYLAVRQDVFCFPVDSVGIFDSKKQVYRLNKSRHHIRGVSDILGIWNGKPLAIEVKTAKGILSEYQKEFLKNWKAKGGIAIVARSVGDVYNALRE